MKSNLFQYPMAIAGAYSGMSQTFAPQRAGQRAKMIIAARRLDLPEQAAIDCHPARGEALAVLTNFANETEKGAREYEKFIPRFKNSLGGKRSETVAPIDLVPESIPERRAFDISKGWLYCIEFCKS